MKKKDFIKLFAEKTNSTLKDAELNINKFLECLEEVLVSGDEITLKGFGKFYVRERKARRGINPKTKEWVEYPAKKISKFSQSKILRNKINK